MDLNAATALVDHIAGGCGGYWTQQTREAWIEAMLQLFDARCAEEAARLLVNRWTGTERPSFGDFKRVYDAAVQHNLMSERPALPPSNRMGLLDYLLLRATQAEDGDRAARHELEGWRRFIDPPAGTQRPSAKPGPHRPALAAALPDLEEARQWFQSQPDTLH